MRPARLFTSPGPTPVADGAHVQSHANMWRISGDFWDNWPQLYSQFDRLRDWTPFRGPGHFPDADMLPLGTLHMGKRTTRFTADEQLTLMSLWSIARSPLILGADLTKLDEATLTLITNEEVIAVNQDSTNNRRTPERGVRIDVDVTGAAKFFLVVDDLRGGNGGDNAVWSEPTLITPDGSKKLTELTWVRATSGRGTNPSTAKSASGGDLLLAGKPVAFGVAAHAKSIIEYDLPPGATRFQAFAGIDATGAPPARGPGGGPAVRFLVFTRSPLATDASAPVPVALSELGLGVAVRVRDLWQRTDLGVIENEFAPVLPHHGACLYRVAPAKP